MRNARRLLEHIVGVVEPAMDRVDEHGSREEGNCRDDAHHVDGRRPSTELGELDKDEAGEGIHERTTMADIDINRRLPLR